MARNTPLTEDVVDKISGLHSSNKDWSAKQIAYELRRQLGKERSKNFSWPADVTVRQWIKKIDEKTSEEDEPWSLAAADSIPPEALPTVVGQWKACMATDTPFTKRHAKWAARLYPLVSDPAQLHAVVNLYVERERTADAMETPLDTAALDAWLTMAEWEARTAYFTRRIRPLAEAGRFGRTKGLGNPKAKYDPSLALHVLSMAVRKVWLERVAFRQGYKGTSNLEVAGLSIADKTLGTLKKIGPKLLAFKELGGSMEPREQIPWVYVHWLMILGEDSGLYDMPDDDCESLMVELADWVVQHRKTMVPPKAKTTITVRVGEHTEAGMTKLAEQRFRELEMSKEIDGWTEDADGNPMYTPVSVLGKVLMLHGRPKKEAK